MAVFEDTTPPVFQGIPSATVNQQNASIVWNTATDDSGVVAGYRFRYGTTQTLSGNGVSLSVSSHSLSGLVNGTYYYQVCAYDNTGNATWSAVQSFVVNYTPPTSPDTTKPTISAQASSTAPTNQNVTLTATFTDNIGVTVRQYRIGDSGAWLDYTNNLTLTENVTVYFRAEDAAGNIGTASLSVSNIDKAAPTIDVTPDTTAPTNQNVTLTATFADNVALVSKQYKIDSGAWTDYASDIVMTANGTVYFKATDTAGNEATAEYTVTNIDRSALDAPVLSVSTAYRTNGTVTVNAEFSEDTVRKEYSLDGTTWLAYSNPVTVSSNTTIQARGYDAVGNMSAASYEINNIVALDPNGPAAVTPTSKISKYNVTVKWNKPATQDKAKITGYEVEYNGQISIVKGASFILKNASVSTGNTIQIRAVDSLGRYGALSEIAFFDVKDVTAPSLGKITAVIDGYTGTLNWNGSDNVGIVKYEVVCNGQTQTVTSGSSAIFENLAVGKYKATVQAFDASGNASKTGSVSLTVKDATPPEKVTGLVVPVANAKYSVVLSWNVGEDNSGKIANYEIQLDSGKILKSSKNMLSISKLSIGTHSYQVRAVDKDKNVGEWSEAQTFEVKDMTAPTSVKAKAVVNGYSVNFELSGKDNSGSIVKYTVTCGDKSVTTTGSTAVLSDFGVGKQTALVVANDAEGNASKAVKVNFMVKDATPPEKVTGLVVPVANAKYSAMLSWTPGEDNSGKIANYEIQLDNGKILKSSKNMLSISKLSIGTHSYQVRAVDKEKNVGEWSEAQTFEVKDMTAPAVVSVKAKVDGNSLVLNWNTPKDNVGVTGYILKHGVNLENTETLTGDDLNWRIDNIAKGTYRYELTAFDAENNFSKTKYGNAVIKNDLPVAEFADWDYPLSDAIPSLVFESGSAYDNGCGSLGCDELSASRLMPLPDSGLCSPAETDLFKIELPKSGASPLLALE